MSYIGELYNLHGITMMQGDAIMDLVDPAKTFSEKFFNESETPKRIA